MFYSTLSEKKSKCAKALQLMNAYIYRCTTDATMTPEEIMKTLQWIYKAIPDINKLLIAIKTEEINRKPPNQIG
jgi:hypothetical protein